MLKIQIFENAQAILKRRNITLKKELRDITMFNRNMMLLDKDIQAVADSKPGSNKY